MFSKYISVSLRVLRTKCQKHVNTTTTKYLKYQKYEEIVGKSVILDITHWPVLRNVVQELCVGKISTFRFSEKKSKFYYYLVG